MNFTEDRVRLNIYKLRNDKRLTQNYLAEQLGVDIATISRIENGGIALTYKYVADIANALGVSVIDLITYPEFYHTDKLRSKKFFIEVDLTDEEFIRLGLKNKLLEVIGDDNMEQLQMVAEPVKEYKSKNKNNNG